MKIAFLVSNINSKSGGNGGHYHSLLETVKQVSDGNETFIISMGNQRSTALEGQEVEVYSVINAGKNVIRTYMEIGAILRREKPDILHAFDVYAFYWARVFGSKSSIPRCLTKCGGENPKKYFPKVDDLILYSRENYTHFSETKKFRKSSLYLIPNRVGSAERDYDRIQEICKKVDKNERVFKFLRISRIGPYYQKSAQQLIDLVIRLNLEGVRCCAIFVGMIEDGAVFESLKSRGKQYAYFFTDNRYTENAKEIVDCGDVVLGTGRSFMEAASLGKAMLCPDACSDYPVLVNKDNFEHALGVNFSERYSEVGASNEENYEHIKNVVIDSIVREELGKFSRWLFDKYFDSSVLKVRYLEVYSNLQAVKREGWFDMLLHAAYLVRSYYK